MLFLKFKTQDFIREREKEKQSFCCTHNLKSKENLMKCIYDITVLCSERQNVTYAYMSPEKTSFLPIVAVQIKGVCIFI